MSSAERPEFFLDRSLGKITASRLRDAGYVVRLIADHYPDDANDVPDEEWIAEGCSQGWVLLTKDQRIRYRVEELEALQGGHLFCSVSGNMNIDGMTQAFLDALPKIERVAREELVGFWHVYRDGQIKRMWP
jgi:PIN like domain